MSAPREVIVVPHTHWDREWYDAFQTFRMNLVDLVDGLIVLLDADPGFAHFQLDGQMAVVDDYLAIRPEREADIRRLAASGRLSMGPWYILMDEFLVSGETMIRDLQIGLTKAAAFGGAMPVGYLPDMFGHIAQMPQLLAQAGFDQTVVWRGVPSHVDLHSFWWEAPDGSTVRAEYLLDGYGNGSVLPEDAKELVGQIDRFVDGFASFLPDGSPLLWMNGTDHLFPKPHLGRVVAEANDLQDRYHLRVGSLADYAALAPTEDLPSWKGELRSGARANLLMGVTSNRTDVRQRAAAAERSLERLAEPLSALLLPPEQWPAPFLAEAWHNMVLNSAHDSICACSIDDVVDAVNVRFAEAIQIGEGLTKRAVRALGASLADTGSAVVNPSARARSGVVALTAGGHDDIPGTQVLTRRGGDQRADGLTVADVATLAPTAVNNMPQLYDAALDLNDDGSVEIRLYADPERNSPPYMPAEVTELLRIAQERPDAPAAITIHLPATQKLLAYAHEVPGYGWQLWDRDSAGALPVRPVSVEDAQPHGAISIGNGLVAVDVDPLTGTFALDGVTGMDRLVDDGDSGDTYNYNPPTTDLVVREPSSVTVRVLERGPLRARVAVDRTYTWPEKVAGNARVGERVVDVTSTIEVQAGSRLVWVTTELDNQCTDHRLRAWFPLPRPATESHAECAFTVVTRGLDAEGGPTEKPLATYPSRRFVCAGGLTVLHDGLPEYELVDRSGDGGDGGDGPARALALTLLRCTGLISQGPMSYRPLPAGPVTPAADAQMLGRQVLRYALLSGDDTGAAYVAADEAFTPLQVTRARGTGELPSTGTRLSVSGAEVSAVFRDAGALTVRVFNPSPEPTTVTIDGHHGWLVDLRGNATEPFEGSFALAPWRIATARLAE